MKLKLEKTPERQIELELPDGKTAVLKITGTTLKKASVDTQILQEAKNEFEAGKMSPIDFISLSIGSLVSNWDSVKDVVLDSGIEIQHLEPIRKAIEDVRANKPESEKKTE